MDHFASNSRPGWQWFEVEMSYDNAKLPHALILSGQATGRADVLEVGLQALRWLTELQTSGKGHFRPIGSNGFYRRGGARATPASSPANTSLFACRAALAVSSAS